MAALKQRDLARFAALAHPAQGVRFTPYTFVQPDRDVRLARTDIANALTNGRRYAWGRTDGRGDLMDWTFEEYFTTILWTKDYTAAPVVKVDEYPATRGNKIDNTRSVYPVSHTVEFFYPASPNKLDWMGLRLVFESDAGQWWIVGVIHDEWTT